MEPDDHLFRREAARMVSVLTRIFGMHNLALAEDVVQDAFCRALESWKFSGMPENPSAWLMATAKNRALDILRKERTARTYAPELGRLLDSEWTLASTVAQLFGPTEIEDDLLRMMFSCCHPRLPEEAQVALILNILCGFSIDEVAAAYVSGHAATEKRLQRSKKVLAESKTMFDVAVASEIAARLPGVQRALYLLFNEGYHGASPESAVRADLCKEAMRLAAMLMHHPLGRTPASHALCALMCLNAARLPARLDSAGNLTVLADQDRSLWNQALIMEGLTLLDLSASGTELSEYHLEAAISSIHARARNLDDTDWGMIVSLYDKLLDLRPSPIIALNRAVAIGQREGPERGLEAISGIAREDRLSSYHFYYAAIGEMELRRGKYEPARNHFVAALGLARSPVERRFLQQKIDTCGGDC